MLKSQVRPDGTSLTIPYPFSWVNQSAKTRSACLQSGIKPINLPVLHVFHIYTIIIPLFLGALLLLVPALVSTSLQGMDAESYLHHVHPAQIIYLSTPVGTPSWNWFPATHDGRERPLNGSDGQAQLRGSHCAHHT